MTMFKVLNSAGGFSPVQALVDDQGRIVLSPAAGGADRELAVSIYFCKTAFTDASVGDTITSTQVIDVSGAPITVSVIWRNQTTATDLSGAPSAANLTLVGSAALTDAQMRASAVPVSAASLPLPTGAALDASITAVTGSKAAGTAAASAVLGGGVYNSTLPAPTTGQQTALQVDPTGRLRVNASEVASGATDSGNPVKIGGVFNSSLITLTNGQRGDLQLGTAGGVLQTPIYGAASSDAFINSSTGFIADRAGVAKLPLSGVMGFNGTTWDRIRSGVVTPTATLTGHQNTLPWAVYNATPTTRTEGQGGPLQADTVGNLNSNLNTLLFGEDSTNSLLGVLSKPIAKPTYAPTLYSEITQVTKANIKASLGNVLSAYVSNSNAAVRYFQLHNKATAPAASDVPIYSFPIPAGTANNPGVLLLTDGFFTAAGAHFATGIGWAVSTTFATFTDSATNTEHVANVHYI